MANAGRLLAVLEHITRHPETHDQSTVARRGYSDCGTEFCAAGTAAFLADKSFDWVPSLTGRYEVSAQLTDGVLVLNFAQEWLELSEGECGRFFGAHLSLRELWMGAAEFTGGAILVPPYGRLPGDRVTVDV